MASFHHLLQHTKQRVESPAKVFAKLKSKVQREEMFAKEEGDFKGKDPLRGLKEKHGGEFKSPRKRADSAWSSTDELKENYMSASYRSEAQALTLSPISSPQKNFRPLEDMHSREGGFLESTSLAHSPFLLNRLQAHADPPQIRDKFKLSSRTPVKMQPVEKDCVRGVFQKDCVRGVFQEAHAPLDRLTSPSQAFSPMKKRLKKTKWEPQEFSKITSSTREMGSEASSRPRRRKISTSEDDSCNNTSMEDLGRVRASSDDQVARETAFPLPRSAEMKDFSIILEKLPVMSPAKMFTYMKERDSKAQQQETHKVSSSTRDFFDGDNFHLSRDSPPLTAHNRAETEDTAFRSVPKSVPPVSQSTVESADSHLDTGLSEGTPIPAVPPQPHLLEDPLVLNTPRVSIPKKHNAAFKHNKLPQLAKFPSESVIHLKKWFLRKNHNGLFVDGIHQEENIPWNSNIIVERVSDNVLKTVSGRIYILVGKMIVDIDSVFPNWLLKKFVNGFPPNWKKLYEKFLSKEDPSSESVTKSDGRGVMAKTKSVKSSVSKPATQQKPLKTPESCPPPSLTSAKVSRSGRIIKPPLEYWRGGRVILDAHMNVTIHECYDTSICIPEVTTTVSGRALRKSSRVFLPQSEGRKQLKSSSSEEASVPLRRVKATVRKRNTAKVNLEEKPSDSPEPPVQVLSSSEEWSGRTTWSSHRIPPPEMTLYGDAGPQKRSEAEKAPTQRSNEQRHDTKKPAVKTSERKWAVSTSPESPFNSEGSQHLLSDDDIFTGKKKRGKRGNKVLNKSRQSHLRTSSSEERGTELRKKTRVTVAPQTLIKHKQSKCTKTLSPTKPLPTQPIRSHKVRKGKAPIPQEQEEDEWTETELMKLKEAVSLYPKHMAGYWAKVARVVGTRSAEECHNQHTSQGSSQTPAKKPKKSKKLKMEPPKNPATDHPVISARVGTLKRKQQVRQFLEDMPREDVEDVFSSAYMQNKRFEMPSICPSEDNDFTLSELAPTTPMSTGFPDAKTPQCLHITPGMMGSPNRSNDDKYVYQLQKRMKKSQFNVCKQAPSSKSFTPTPSVKRTMSRCGNTENNTFVVWEMFPGNDGALSESGEEEDFYFSDND